KILLGLAAVFALFWTIKTKKIFPAIITLGMIVGIVLTLFLSKTIQLPGFYVYMGFVALAFIYGLTAKEKKSRGKNNHQPDVCFNIRLLVVGTKPLAWQHGFTANICAFGICSWHYRQSKTEK
ncbi:MAG: hypothetical protein KAT48_15180, partial [Bacteroidales bacterium]|nr:hypothetical protein [Bacteroidales bacterium]